MLIVVIALIGGAEVPLAGRDDGEDVGGGVALGHPGDGRGAGLLRDRKG